MIAFLVKLFIKDSDHVSDVQVRGRYGMLAGCVGVFCNMCLFTAKFLAGLITNSIAITADAFNNLSDAGSSLLTLVGFKMANMPADNEHPFGHGRIEYLSGLGVSVAILVVGIELLKTSFSKILNPEAITFSTVSLVILLISVFTKLWMCMFNKTLAKKISSGAMHATSMDSLTDAVATSAVLLGILVGEFFHIKIDGWIGMLVAAFILYTGVTTARDSLSPLLGAAPDKAFVKDVGETVMAHKDVVGIHDLIVHDYGPGRLLISLHAEMPCDMNILAMHDVVDVIELELRHKFQCEVTIHMDPVAVGDEETALMKSRVAQLVREIDPEITIHDFRMVEGTTHTNLIFDAVVPHKFHITDREVAEKVRDGICNMEGGRYYAVVRVEKAFI